MAKIRIILLGGLELAWSGRAGAVSLPRKAKALVAYLASHGGQPQSREKLADLLWGDSGEKHARMSLRQALRTIRKALPANATERLVATDDQIALELSDIDVDVLRFESLAAQHEPAALEDAAELYAGDFLDGFSIKEDAFEAWVRSERGRLRGLAIDALRALVTHYADLQDWERSIQAAHRLLSLDPVQEDVHRALMCAYGAQGRKDMALKQFEICRESLQRELGIQPGRESQQMLVAIRLGRTALRQSQKPQVLVLPFTAISHGSEERELAAGLAEHVLTALSKLGWLSVAAHRSGAASVARGTNTMEAARQHGADFALEGSLQRAAGRLRIMVQLIDVTSSGHLWAERFDHEIGDVLDLEDEVTQKIAAATEQVLANAVADAAARGAGPQIDEKAGIRKANRLMRRIDGNDLGRAIGLLRDITAARPDSKGAHQVRCFCHVLNVAACWSLEPDREVAEGLVTASKSLELASGDFLSHTVMAYASVYARRFDQAISEARQTIRMNPNSSTALGVSGIALAYAGETREAQDALATAMEIAERDPCVMEYQWAMAISYLALGDSEAAAEWAEAAVLLKPAIATGHLIRAAILANLGRSVDAREAMAQAMRCAPRMRLSAQIPCFPIRSPSLNRQFLDGLNKAGLKA